MLQALQHANVNAEGTQVMNLNGIYERQTMCALLDEVRRKLNEASEASADKCGWTEYREAELLYAQASQKFINNEMKDAYSLVQQSLAKVSNARLLLQ